MSTVIVNVRCPICEDKMEIECEYEPADPSVGIMNGGPIPSDDVPVVCASCDAPFSDEQIAALRNQVERECEDWRPPDDEPDDDDGWWDRADTYYDS